MPKNHENRLQTITDDSIFWSRHQVFLREARQASHQALYYLCIIDHYPENRKHRPIFEQYATFAYEQSRAMLNGVHLQGAYWQREKRLGSAEARDYQHAFAIVDQWQDTVRDPLNKSQDLSAKDAQAITAAFEAFLDATEPQGWWHKFWGHTIYNFLRYLRKHFSLLVSLLLALGIIGLVPAVRNLIIDIGWPAIPMLLFFPIYTWIFHRFSRPLFPYGKMAQASFRKYRYQSLEPSRGLRRFPHDGIMENKVFAQITLMAGLQLALLAGGIFLAYLFWEPLSQFLWHTALSVFFILSIMYAMMVVANLIDVSDFYHLRPIRLLALCAGAMLLVISFLSEKSDWISFAAFAGVALALLIPFFRDRRRTSLLFFGLLFGGLAVSLVLHAVTRDNEKWRQQPDVDFTRLTVETWPHSPADGPASPVVLIAASGGGSRAAIYTALTLRRLNIDFPEIARQVQAISSVSGGSLANAAYVSRKLQFPLSAQEDSAGTFRQSLHGMKDAVADDFILPTLLGAFVLFDSRGRRIERYWEEGEVGLSATHLSDLSKTWIRQSKTEDYPPFPIPMFNSTSLDGHNVVISPFAKQMFTNPEVNGEASGEQNAYRRDSRNTWVYYRDGIYGLEDLLSAFDPRLSAAVRASANFPFGFPLIEIETGSPLFFNPDPQNRETGISKTVALTDGGALSNSGMWSLTNLMMNNAEQLRERGVLLIVVEASIMPEYSGVDKRLTSLAGVIIDQSPIGQNLHRRIFSLLREEFGDRLGIVQLDLIPTVDFQVMTTWALDRRSVHKLQDSFTRRWQEEKGNIEGLWRNLNEASTTKFSISRPPLD